MKRVSLIQQLWFLVAAAVVLAAAGSLTANLFNARNYLQQQLAAQQWLLSPAQTGQGQREWILTRKP